MKNEAWRDAVDGLDDDILHVQQMAAGSFWPVLAVAAALIDVGVVDRKRLLDITETLHDFVLAEADPSVHGDEAAFPLHQMMEFLDAVELSEGQVLQQLRTLSSMSALASVLRHQGRPPRERE